MTHHEALTISGFRVRPVKVPPAGVELGKGLIESVPLVLLDLETREGIIGTSYVICYTPVALAPTAALLTGVCEMLVGDKVVPAAIETKLKRHFKLLSWVGLTAIAGAAVDMAAWDALAKSAGLPLVRMLGGEAKPIPAYRSVRKVSPHLIAQDAAEVADQGFQAVKPRIGFGTLEDDLAVVKAIREAVGDRIKIMVDYNQALSVTEAIRRIRRLDDEDLFWIEEPTRSDDFAGHARIAREARTPIQLGENWWGSRDASRSLLADASDHVMLEVMKLGGVTGWLRGAALVEPYGLQASSHLFPEYSAHLLAVTPTAHWLEYLDFAGPLQAEPMVIDRGHALIPDRPGCGIVWDEAAVSRFAAD